MLSAKFILLLAHLQLLLLTLNFMRIVYSIALSASLFISAHNPAFALDQSPQDPWALLQSGDETSNYSLSPLWMAQADNVTASTGNTSTSDTSLTPAPHRSPYYAGSLKLSIANEPDLKGLLQDSELFLLYQLAMVGLLYLLPEDISKWDKDAKRGDPLKKWDDNVNNLGKDGDEWAVNYIGHPYFGATYYTRARIRGFNRKQSLWYSIAMSTIYEYGIEAVFEPVSVQDLIFTPVGGAVLGEYFMIGRQKIINRAAARGRQTSWDTLGLFFTDPIGTINRKVMESFSHYTPHATLTLQPIIASSQINKHSNSSHYGNNLGDTYGIQARLKW